MKIFITGGSGFFGQNLVRLLLAETSHELVLLTRDISRKPFPADDRLQYFAGDITDSDSVKEGLKGCDSLIHAAAKVATWAKDSNEFDRVNTGATLDIVRSAADLGLEKIIYVSSFMGLGCSESLPLDERGPHIRDYHFNDYERTKYFSNRMLLELMTREQIPLIITYPTVMFGPGPLTAGNLIVNIIIDYMKGRLPALVGDGKPRWNYVFVEDVARAHVLALEKAQPPDNFIFGGENVSNGEFFETVEKVTGIARPRFSIPFTAAKVIGWCELLLANLTGRIPMTTPAAIDIFQHNWIYDSSKAKETLGYNPLGLEQALTKTVEWIRREVLTENNGGTRN